MKSVIGALLEAFSAKPEYKEPSDALMPALVPLYETLSPDTYGGAILLGVDGVCIIAHGSSSARAIENGINVARDLVEHDMVAEIRDAIAAAAPAG
jgi:glycerol-3-phosphate acyltransferase PlsX